jgi:phosphohistidine phosphatase
MAATLYLMRHGIAEDGLDDEARQLTEEGKRRVAQIAQGLKAVDVAPDLVLASPLVRAQQTAKIAAEILAPKVGVETFAPLAIGREPEDLVAELAGYRGYREILLVGHQPSLGELGSLLLTGQAHLSPLPFKKGSVAAVLVHSLPPRTPGELLFFLPPKFARSLASASV